MLVEQLWNKTLFIIEASLLQKKKLKDYFHKDTLLKILNEKNELFKDYHYDPDVDTSG